MCDKEAFRLNKRLVPVKGTYFFTMAAVSSLFSYLGLYMKEVGLTMSETGIIWGVMPFFGAIIRVVVGAIADKVQRHKGILVACSIVSGVVHCFLLFVPHATVSSVAVQLHCGDRGAFFESCAPNAVSNMSDEPVASAKIQGQYFSGEQGLSHKQIAFNISDCFLECYSPTGSDVRICLQEDSDAASPSVPPSRCLVLHSSEDEHGSSAMKLDLELRQLGYYNVENSSSVVESRRVYLSSYLVNGSRYTSMTCQTPNVLLCKLKCPTLTETRTCSMKELDGNADAFGRTFWIFSMIFLVGQIAFAPIFSLIDAITYDFLGDERQKWGKQRLWGTVGLGIFALASGFLMDLFTGGEGKTDYTVAFVIFAVVEFLSAFMTSLYHVSDDVTCSRPAFKDMPALLKRPDVALLLLVVVVFGMYTGLIETFLFIHLKEMGQPPQLLLGLAIVSNCVPQVVMFFFSGAVVKKIGHFNCLCVSCAAFAVRMCAYSVLSNPWMVLLIEPLHSITFGLFYAATSAYGSLITPKGLHGTIQGIIGSLYFGIGRGVGSVEGGQLIEAYGTGTTFRIHGVSAAILLVLFVVVRKCCIDPLEKTKKEEETENGTAGSETEKMREKENSDEDAHRRKRSNSDNNGTKQVDESV